MFLLIKTYGINSLINVINIEKSRIKLRISYSL